MTMLSQNQQQYNDNHVNKSELSDSELAQIMDIVTRKTGMKESQVRIVRLKIMKQKEKATNKF